MTDSAAIERQRIDKWLWHARIVKTRTLAQRIVGGGKVRVNRDKVVASSASVRVGDVLTITLLKRVLVLEVVGFCDRRGPASLAQTLYEDLSAPAPVRGTEDPSAAADAAVHPGGLAGGRPNKRDRRRLANLKKTESG
ncbi:MAG: RNA-binding S4 domain-containing protein [Pseudomonadota bacterium]